MLCSLRRFWGGLCLVSIGTLGVPWPASFWCCFCHICLLRGTQGILDLGPTLKQLHLQRSHFQMRSRSEVLGGHVFGRQSSPHYRLPLAGRALGLSRESLSSEGEETEPGSAKGLRAAERGARRMGPSLAQPGSGASRSGQRPSSGL